MQYRRAAPRDTVASSFVHQYFCATGRSASLTAFPRSALVVIHKSVQDRHLGMKTETAALDVGRNKSARHQQGRMFPAIGAPETPVLRLTRGQAYSGLRRDVYNDERSAWEREKRGFI